MRNAGLLRAQYHPERMPGFAGVAFCEPSGDAANVMILRVRQDDSAAMLVYARRLYARGCCSWLWYDEIW